MRDKRCSTHKDLDVWKDSMDLVCSIYRITKAFPRDELYGLVSQLRRASVSILANISEGAARQSTKEFIHYLSISRASLSEVEAEVMISQRLEYITQGQCMNLLNEIESVGVRLSGLIRSLRRKLI